MAQRHENNFFFDALNKSELDYDQKIQNKADVQDTKRVKTSKNNFFR